mmetsp:Transcript_67358/g.209210  ORF Transcript_67358/g.209210 Transcript_67358/m.209210 type:complete len:323 (-) Transcript_67358:108-1076(-)
MVPRPDGGAAPAARGAGNNKQVWVPKSEAPKKPAEKAAKKSEAAGAAAEAQRAGCPREPQVYSRSLLLKVMEKRAQDAHAQQVPRYRTPSTTATEESDGEEPDDQLTHLTLAPAEPAQPKAKVVRRARAGTQLKALKRASAELHPEAPEFVPPWMLAPMPVAPLPGAMPAAAAAAHFAAAEAAERAAAKVRAARQTTEAGEGKESESGKEARRQIEYYFSVRNVCRDFYLRSLMDDEGWISLKEIAAFPRIRALSVDAEGAAAVLDNSPMVELSKDRQSVRIMNEAIRQAFPKVDAPPPHAATATKQSEGKAPDPVATPTAA